MSDSVIFIVKIVQVSVSHLDTFSLALAPALSPISYLLFLFFCFKMKKNKWITLDLERLRLRCERAAVRKRQWLNAFTWSTSESTRKGFQISYMLIFSLFLSVYICIWSHTHIFIFKFSKKYAKHIFATNKIDTLFDWARKRMRDKTEIKLNATTTIATKKRKKGK